jgi:hypothetical protein
VPLPPQREKILSGGMTSREEQSTRQPARVGEELSPIQRALALEQQKAAANATPPRAAVPRGAQQGSVLQQRMRELEIRKTGGQVLSDKI